MIGLDVLGLENVPNRGPQNPELSGNTPLALGGLVQKHFGHLVHHFLVPENSLTQPLISLYYRRAVLK